MTETKTTPTVKNVTEWLEIDYKLEGECHSENEEMEAFFEYAGIEYFLKDYMRLNYGGCEYPTYDIKGSDKTFTAHIAIESYGWVVAELSECGDCIRVAHVINQDLEK